MNSTVAKEEEKRKISSSALKEYIQNEAMHFEVLTRVMKTICSCCSFFSSRKYPNLVLVLSYFNL